MGNPGLEASSPLRATLAAGLLLLAGCSARHWAGRPERLNFIEDVDAYEAAMEPSFIDLVKEYDDADNESKRANARGQFARHALIIYDARFDLFLDDLSVARKRFDAGTDITAIGLDTAAVLFSPVSTKSILAGLSGLTTATKGAISEAYFYEQTLPVIVKQMQADRQAVLVDILSGLQRSTNVYPFESLHRDLTRYYHAGTIDGALVGILQRSAQEQQEAEEALRRIRTNNESLAVRIRQSIDHWLADPALTDEERNLRAQQLRKVVGQRFGQDNGELAELWMQSASSSDLEQVMRTLRIPLRAAEPEEPPTTEARREQASNLVESHFDEAKKRISAWFQALDDNGETATVLLMDSRRVGLEIADGFVADEQFKTETFDEFLATLTTDSEPARNWVLSVLMTQESIPLDPPSDAPSSGPESIR